MKLDLEDTPGQTIETLNKVIGGLLEIMEDDEAVRNGNKRRMSKEQIRTIYKQAIFVQSQLIEELSQ